MGKFKPLMMVGAQTVLDRIVSTFRKAGIANIRVVTGHRTDAVRSALAFQPVTVVHNPSY